MQPPRLLKKVFDTMHYIPDLIADGKPFDEVYGTVTSDKDWPSFNSSAEKYTHGIPLNPSGQFARNVGRTLLCTKCGKPRVLYSSRKLNWKDKQDLELEVADLMYTCVMDMQGCIPANLSSETK